MYENNCFITWFKIVLNSTDNQQSLFHPIIVKGIFLSSVLYNI